MFNNSFPPPPGKQPFGSEHIKAPLQSCAVSQPEWLLLAVWWYSGASCFLQRSDTPWCHWLSSHLPTSFPSTLLPLTTQIFGLWCEERLQLGSAQFWGSGFTEPPVWAQTDTDDTELWCGAMLCPTPQVKNLLEYTITKYISRISPYLC